MAIFALVIDPCTSSPWLVYPSSKPGDDWFFFRPHYTQWMDMLGFHTTDFDLTWAVQLRITIQSPKISF